ncbi:MAG: hypothetical protein NTV80_16730 [Verrucomicrobia bacterium]|nr:hypothetical protein [Verrucomicrobiota bacterium]
MGQPISNQPVTARRVLSFRMSFDPNIPATNADATSAMFRSQFNGLKALIDAVPTLTAAQVDSTKTLPQGTPANASVSVIGNTLHFSFDLPQGQEGTQGVMGAQGPPFAQAVVDAVNTVDANTPAAVSVSFDGSNVRFTFDIPRGFEGAAGEVSQAQLDCAIDGTSANTNGIGTLDTAFADPPTLADLEALRQKMNEMILNGRR